MSKAFEMYCWFIIIAALGITALLLVVHKF
jgi:hypothetical protein